MTPRILQRCSTTFTPKRTAIGVGLLIFLVWLIANSEPLLLLFAQRQAAREWVQNFGSLAPIAYITLCVTQILVAPLPGHLMALFGGYLFGTVWGSAYSLLGLGLGAGLAAAIARRVGRPIIQHWIGASELSKWERRLRVRSPLTWWLIFLFPIADLVYYVAGLSAVPMRWLLVAVLLGRGPSLIAENWVGAQAVSLPAELVFGMFVALGALALFVYLNQRGLRWLTLTTVRHTRRIIRKQVRRTKNQGG